MGRRHAWTYRRDLIVNRARRPRGLRDKVWTPWLDIAREYCGSKPAPPNWVAAIAVTTRELLLNAEADREDPAPTVIVSDTGVDR
jgi:hypothetical protein